MSRQSPAEPGSSLRKEQGENSKPSVQSKQLAATMPAHHLGVITTSVSKSGITPYNARHPNSPTALSCPNVPKHKTRQRQKCNFFLWEYIWKVDNNGQSVYQCVSGPTAMISAGDYFSLLANEGLSAKINRPSCFVSQAASDLNPSWKSLLSGTH